MDYSFLEAFYARLSTERRKKTGTTTTTTTVAKIAIQDEFSFRMERGQGSRVSDCRDDLQRRRSFPGITAAFSGVFRAVYKAGIRRACRYFARRFDRVMNLASIPVRFLIDRNAAAFVPRREIACRRCTIKAVE